MKTISIPSLMVLSLAIILFAGCEEYGTNPPSDIDPVITDKGTPVGEPTSAVIDGSGGGLETADGRLSLTIPAGALQGPTEISIQPVTGEAPLGLGTGYRLMPEGLTFAKPVELRFKYEESLLMGTPAEFLWIVTQASDGSWNALLKSSLDETTGSVRCETTHFSDWALARFIDLKLTPASPTVKKGESVKLQLTGFLRDQQTSDEDELAPLLPITSDGEVLAPLTPIPTNESRIMEFRVKQWRMNGLQAPVSNQNGTLTPDGQSATFKAPDGIPETNPVAVSAALETTNKAGRKSSYELVSNIRIGEYLSLTLTIDGKTHHYYQHGVDGMAPPEDPSAVGTVRCIMEDGGLQIYAAEDMVNAFVGGIDSPSVGTRMLDCQRSGDGMVFVQYESGIDFMDSYYIRTATSGDDCKVETACASISFTLTTFEGTFGSIVTGSFSGTIYEDQLSFWDTCTSSAPHSVEGKFMLMIYH